MMLAIESFVRLFEKLLIESAASTPAPAWHADNDNNEPSDEDRRWGTYR